jgi:hypothetical protein
MTRNVAFFALLFAAATSFPAHAQFSGLKSMLGKSDSTASSTTVPDAAAQDALVQRFVSAQSKSLEAQAAFAKAFGLAEQVQLLEAERQALSGGAVNVDAMKKTVSVSANAQKAIDERLAAQPELNDESKKHYADGLVSLLASAVEARMLVTEASSFASGMQSLGAMQMATLGRKLMAGAWVAKESPGFAKSLYSSTTAALTFAKKNKVKAPSNADALLDGLK